MVDFRRPSISRDFFFRRRFVDPATFPKRLVHTLPPIGQRRKPTLELRPGRGAITVIVTTLKVQSCIGE